MSFTVSQQAGASAAGTTTITLPSAVPAGAFLLAWCVPKAGTISVSDNINGAWSLTTPGTVTGSTKQTVFAYKVNSASASAGAMTVTLTANATGQQWIQVVVFTVSGTVTRQTAFSNRAPSSVLGTDISISSSAAHTGSGQLDVFGGTTDTEAAQTYTAGSGWTLSLDSGSRSGGNLAGAQTMAMEYILSGATGSLTGHLTTSPGQNWGAMIESFIDTPSSDTTSPTTPGSFISTAQDASSASFSWTASTDNVGVTRYEITTEGPM
jgi:hypothetical protein